MHRTVRVELAALLRWVRQPGVPSRRASTDGRPRGRVNGTVHRTNQALEAGLACLAPGREDPGGRVEARLHVRPGLVLVLVGPIPIQGYPGVRIQGYPGAGCVGGMGVVGTGPAGGRSFCMRGLREVHAAPTSNAPWAL
eukprot:796638-Prorocentrum_minimum.AAC.1